MNINKLFFGLLFCLSFFVVSSYAQDVNGNGDVVSQDRNIEPFSTLEIGGVFNVYLTQGDKEALTIEADENLLELIKTENRGDKLVIGLEKGVNIKKAEKKNLYITIRDISRLKIGGVVNVKTESTIVLQSLELDLNGVSNTELDIECKYLDAESDMVGSLTLTGQVDEADIRNGGVGSLEAFDLQVKKLSLRNSGVGSADVMAQDEISISASGIGGVRYKGDPVVKELKSSGLSKIKKL